MKKVFLLLFAVIVFSSADLFAQEKGTIRAGGGLALGTAAAINDSGGEKLGIGLTLGGDYFITDKIAISPAYTFFFPSKVAVPGAEISLSVSAFDVDGKYYLLSDKVKVYGLFGFSFGFAKAKSVFDFGFGPQEVTVKDNEFGINIGGGVDYYLSESMFLNGQLKYNTPIAQLAINLGVGFHLN